MAASSRSVTSSPEVMTSHTWAAPSALPVTTRGPP